MIATFSTSVAAVSPVSPALFLVLKEADAGAMFLVSGLGFSARGGSGVAVGLLCDILRD